VLFGRSQGFPQLRVSGPRTLFLIHCLADLVAHVLYPGALFMAVCCHKINDSSYMGPFLDVNLVLKYVCNFLYFYSSYCLITF
jgi:hypothetical protein